MLSLLDSAVVYDLRGETPELSFTGFWSPEFTGRWSVEKTAEIVLPLSGSDAPYAAVILEYFPHVFPELQPTQRVAVWVDGMAHDNWVLRDEWYRKRAIIIDRSKLKDRDQATIRFSLPDRAKPSAFGKWPDDRYLALMIRRLYVLDLADAPRENDPLVQIGRRFVGTESRKTWDDKHLNGFWSQFITGPNVLDIGFSSYGNPHVVPIMDGATGVDIDYPDYDGRTLPFAEGSQDAVYSSHCLEHIPDYLNAIQDWHRVVKVGGHIIIAVPNRSLYERRRRVPSRWNLEHLRMYSPASLLAEIDAALAPNSFRLRHLSENDDEYDYSLTPDQHPAGNYEIVAVIEKIAMPEWRLSD